MLIKGTINAVTGSLHSNGISSKTGQNQINGYEKGCLIVQRSLGNLGRKQAHDASKAFTALVDTLGRSSGNRSLDLGCHATGE